MSGAESLPPGQRRLGPWLLDRQPWPGRLDLWLVQHAERRELIGLLAAWQDTSEGRACARRAVAALRTLSHEAIPALLDHCSADGVAWVVTEAVEGELLSDVLEGGPVDWRDACTVVWSAGRALASAHAHGISHRDVSPAQIVIGTDWTVHVIGWDLAMDDAALAAAANPPLGALTYVAPEVIAQPLQHGPRADLYALGIVFYEMMTGRSAFPAAAVGDRPEAATARLLEWKTRASPLDASAHAPPWLASLLRRATDPAPEKRLPDVDALVGWLDAAQGAWARMVGGRSGVSAIPRQATPPPVLAAQEPRLAASAIRLPPPADVALVGAIAPNVVVSPALDMYYMVAAGFGLLAGTLFSFFVILFAELG
jgi:serine/threonine-protein kinase